MVVVGPCQQPGKNLLAHREQIQESRHCLAFFYRQGGPVAYTHLLGVMIATDYRDLSETELSRELTDLLCIMLGHYKGVRSEAELGPWLEKARHLIS